LSASYDNVALTLTLSFDRAIDISGFQGGAIEVDDGTFNMELYTGDKGAVLLDDQTMQCPIYQQTDSSDPGVTLSVGGGNGIVAVDGSGEWAGCSELSLPFG